MFEKYFSVPKEIKAVQFTRENKDKIFRSLTGRFCADWEDGEPILKVMTANDNVVTVRVGDWIVEDDEMGTYYPVKDDIFRENYAQM